MGFLKCVVYAALTGILSFLLGRIVPAAWFQEDRFPYRSCRWERGGAVYNRIGIRKWQARVPDMSRILPQWMPAKRVTRSFSRELPRMITETCIAEWIHVLLCFTVLPCLWLWPGPGGAVFTLLYILGNIPFILIQRYNRPRLMGLRDKMARRATGKDA